MPAGQRGRDDREQVGDDQHPGRVGAGARAERDAHPRVRRAGVRIARPEPPVGDRDADHDRGDEQQRERRRAAARGDHRSERRRQRKRRPDRRRRDQQQIAEPEHASHASRRRANASGGNRRRRRSPTPTANHTTNRIHVSAPSPVITSRHNSAPSAAVTNPNGARNGRTASGLRNAQHEHAGAHDRERRERADVDQRQQIGDRQARRPGSRPARRSSAS